MQSLAKNLIITLLCVCVFRGLPLEAADVQLSWSANTESDLAGYRPYWGQSSGTYSNQAQVGLQTNYTVSGLTEGTWYFALTAFDTSGNESGKSIEVSVFIPPGPPPPPPTGEITIGETSILSEGDSGNGNLLLAQVASLNQAATIQSLSFYVGTPSGQLRLGIYDSSGPSAGPGIKKAETLAFTPIVGWNTASVITPVALTAGNYWLAYLPQSSSLAFRIDRSSGQSRYYSFPFGVMPGTFSTAPTADSFHWSFYATLTTASTSAPTITLSANPTSILAGQSSTLSWSSTDASSVSIDQGIGSVALSGSQSVAPTATTLYTATATRADGTTTSSATVTVSPPPPPPPPSNVLNVAKSVSRCSFVLSAEPPDTTGGWTARFYRGTGTAVGNADSSAPFTRTTELVIGTYGFYVVFSKSGQASVTYPTVQSTCP